MSPVVSGSAPPQTAITAVKSLRWGSIASRRFDGVDRLVLVDACCSMALVCLRSSSALVTSSMQSASRLTSERDRDNSMEKSGLSVIYPSKPNDFTSRWRARIGKLTQGHSPSWNLEHVSNYFKKSSKRSWQNIEQSREAVESVRAGKVGPTVAGILQHPCHPSSMYTRRTISVVRHKPNSIQSRFWNLYPTLPFYRVAYWTLQVEAEFAIVWSSDIRTQLQPTWKLQISLNLINSKALACSSTALWILHASEVLVPATASPPSWPPIMDAQAYILRRLPQQLKRCDWFLHWICTPRIPPLFLGLLLMMYEIQVVGVDG